MASVEYSIKVTIQDVVEEVHAAACLLLALGRERLLAVAGGYLWADDPDETGGLTLDDLALRAAGRALLACTAARAELDAMTPAQALALAQERAADATKELVGPPRIGTLLLLLPQPGQQRRDEQGRRCEVQRCKVAATPGDEPLVEYLYEALEEHGGGVGEALMPLSQWEGLDPS
jgi:hypothetical protein